MEKEKRHTKTLSTFMKLFECPVCFERISPPVTVCINGHAVCSDCRKQLLTCPTCKAGFSQYKNTMIDQIIEENLFLCKFHEKGCTVEGKYREIEEHEKKFCRHRSLICSLLTKQKVLCNEEIPIWEYYVHVLRNHPQENLKFLEETQRVVNVYESFTTKNVLIDVKTQKILIETIHLNREARKFYIMFQYIGLYDDSVFRIRLFNPAEKYRELVFRNLCLPIGISTEDLENSEKCLVLDANVLKGFVRDNLLSYSLQIDTIPRKWYRVISDKLRLNSLRVLTKTRRDNDTDAF